MRLGFSQAVRDFAETVPEVLEYIWKKSANDVVREMQNPRNGPFHVGAGSGNLPVWTEFLRSSLLASTTSMPMMIPGHEPANMYTRYPYDPTKIQSVIFGAKLGQTLYFGYTAHYAAFQNYGTRKFQGRRFRDLAAQRWPDIVAKNVTEARRKFGV